MHRTTSDPLDGPKLKIEWAEQNIANLEREINEFFAANPWRQVRIPHPDGLKEDHKVILDRPISSHITMRAGNIIHDIRSSLDLLACCLARANGYTNVSGTYFPFGKTKEIFETPKVQRKIKKLPAAAARYIRRLKPYKGGCDFLHAIHELDIEQKHLRLISIGMANPDHSWGSGFARLGLAGRVLCGGARRAARRGLGLRGRARAVSNAMLCR